MLTGVAYAQFTPMTARGYQYKSIKVDSALFIPTFCGVPTFTISGVKEGAIGLDSCNNRFYYYNPKTNVWSIITSGSGSSGVDSITSKSVLYIDSIKVWKGGVVVSSFTIDRADGLLSGGQVALISGTTFSVASAIYGIAGTRYNSPDTTIILSAIPDTARTDVIFVNTSGVVGHYTGIEGAGIPPALDPETELGLAYISLSPEGIAAGTDSIWRNVLGVATQGFATNGGLTSGPWTFSGGGQIAIQNSYTAGGQLAIKNTASGGKNFMIESRASDSSFGIRNMTTGAQLLAFRSNADLALPSMSRKTSGAQKQLLIDTTTKVVGWGDGGSGGSGTVTSFGKVDGYGITSSVTNPTTTPVHTIAVDTATLFPAIRATLPPETYDSLKTKYPIVITSTGGLDSIGLSQSYQDSLVNDVTKINDSTIRVFKAGTSTDLLIRGNASGGGGSQNLNQVAQVDSSLRTTIVAYSPNAVDTVAYRDSIVRKLNGSYVTANNQIGAKLLNRYQDETYNTNDPAGKKFGRYNDWLIWNNYNGGPAATNRRGFIRTQGYNVTGGGGAEIPTEGYWQTSLESDYVRTFEWYHQMGGIQPSTGAFNYRPIMISSWKDTMLSDFTMKGTFVNITPIDTAMPYMKAANGTFTIDNVPGRFSTSSSNTILQIKKSGRTIALTNNGSNLSFTGAAASYSVDKAFTPSVSATQNLGGATAFWQTTYTKGLSVGYVLASDANYTQTITDHTINFAAITANRTLTLMFGSSPGAVLEVVTGQATYKITFAGSYTVKNIDGTTATEIPAGKACRMIWHSTGTYWQVVSASSNL